MLRFENKYILYVFNFLAYTLDAERKIVWVEFGKKIEFGISKPLPYGCGMQMGLKFYANFTYFEYFIKTCRVWLSVIKNKINYSKNSNNADMV